MTGWTEERVETLKRLWAKGNSASEIALVLQVTRNTVIGKVQRLKLPKRLTTNQRRPRAVNFSIANVKELAEKKSKFVFEEMCKGAPEPLMVALEDLSDRSCRWPIGDPRRDDFGFCGHPQEEGSSYCPHHADRAVNTVPKSRRGLLMMRKAA